MVHFLQTITDGIVYDLVKYLFLPIVITAAVVCPLKSDPP